MLLLILAFRAIQTQCQQVSWIRDIYS